MRIARFVVFVVVLLTFGEVRMNVAAGKREAHPYQPHINPSQFQTTIDNPYYPLIPGTSYRFMETTRHGTSENIITVTRDTKEIMGVTCVVVSDNVTRNGEDLEKTFDWFAPDKEGNVWYFGEDTKEFGAGGKVSTKGSWEAGVNGAQPGIIMVAHPVVGGPYRQEYSHDAMDMGQIVALNQRVSVPIGPFADCVKTKEWSLLEPGLENKWYARGVGCVRSKAKTPDGPEVSVLVAMSKP